MDLKELKRIVSFLRKSGVTKYSENGLTLELGPEVVPKYSSKHKSKEIDESLIPTDTPTDEELLFWSAGGAPEQKDS